MTGTVNNTSSNGTKSSVNVLCGNAGLRIGSGSALEWNAGSGSAFKSKFRSCRGSKWSRGGPWTPTMETCWLKMEPWKVCIQVVADLHHLDDKQECRIRIRIKRKCWICIRIKAKSWIRIRFKVMRIRNPDAMIPPTDDSKTHDERQKLCNVNKGACPYLRSPAVQGAGPEGGVRWAAAPRPPAPPPGPPPPRVQSDWCPAPPPGKRKKECEHVCTCIVVIMAPTSIDPD